MQKIIIQQGNSVTIAISLPPDKMSDVEDVFVSLGTRNIARLSTATLIPTVDANTFLVQIKSALTANLSGLYSVIVAVDYSDLGVRKNTSEDLQIQIKQSSNGFSNDSISEVVDATLVFEIIKNDLIANVTLATIYRGFSAYEIAVENGFEGTEQEWLNSLKGEQGIQGIQGLKGLKGDTGEQGIQGANAPVYIRRFENQSNISYCGKALSGSAENQNFWNITRISINNVGVTTTAMATNVAWTNRNTITYN